jgi:lysophospholipase L1-like esterase
MAAGLYPPALRPSEFLREPAGSAAGLIAPDDPRLRWIGRSRIDANGARPLEWSGTELRARFTGSALTLRLAPANGKTNYFSVEIDGRKHLLALLGEGPADWRLREPLAPGEHELRLVKRTEASQADSVFLGLRLGEGGRLLEPPPARALTLAFYGDSITAGACNGDIGTDQYDDLYSHDGTRAYGALTAQALGANYLGFAVSGIGITASWDPLLMPQVWNRYAPRLDAPVAPADSPEPDVVLVNIGQNDFGFPHSQGRPIAADFAPRYLDFVRTLRARYPQARLVLLIGGMTAWKEEPAIPKALDAALATLRAEGDARVWRYTFQAFSWAHPRIDVHAQMADELVKFLRTEVLNK